MKVCVASDHAGVELKDKLIELMKEMSVEVSDLGPNGPASVDYPDYAKLVSKAVVEKKVDLGLLICGTGLGMSYTANKFKGIRAALCTNEFMAKMSKDHNDANILVLGARVVGLDLAKEILKAFLNTPFSGEERHCGRLQKITNIEQSC